MDFSLKFIDSTQGDFYKRLFSMNEDIKIVNCYQTIEHLYERTFPLDKKLSDVRKTRKCEKLLFFDGNTCQTL